jgi:hypothetical protein
MKLSKELLNGIIIFIGIGVYFLLINIFGFSDIMYLRYFNVFFIFYGINRTLKMKLAESKINFASDSISALSTGLIGVLLSVIGLVIYSYIKGGDAYMEALPKNFWLGGNSSINVCIICTLIEGIASSVIVTMLLMFYWNNRLKTE